MARLSDVVQGPRGLAQINMGVDILLSGALLAVCMWVTPVNCAQCSNSPAASQWMQACVKVRGKNPHLAKASSGGILRLAETFM